MRHLLLVLALVGAGELRSQSALPKRQIVEELRLDATAEDFPNIWRLRVGPLGQMAVFVREDQNLRLYDSTGRKVATFGRRGSGPKETRAVNQMGWKSDTVWMYDAGNKRMTYVTQAGEFLRHEMLTPDLNKQGESDDGKNPAGVIFSFTPVNVVPDGRVLAFVSVGTGRDETGRIKARGMLLVSNVDGSNRKFVGPAESNGGAQVSFRDKGDTLRVAGIPFAEYPVVVYAADGSRFGNVWHTLGEKSGTYTVRVIATTGDTTFIRSYPFAGDPIPAAKRDSAIDAILTRRNSYTPSAKARLRDLARPLTPKIYSRITDMVLGKNGTTWLEVRGTAAGHEEIALDARGNPLFSIQLPPNTMLVDASLKSVWAIQTDDDGLQSVVRYRIK